MQATYYPAQVMISSNGHYPPRSPPPYNLSRRSTVTHSPKPSVDRRSQIAISPANSALAETSRHFDLWFCDGSIVLRAEDILFRVHKSHLARHSAFFRDLFSLPQPGVDVATCSSSTDAKSHPALQVDTTNEIEGCPVLRLYDAAEDVENLLTALYDGPNFGDNDPADFRMVSGILRLATKYLVDSLRAKALAHLSIAWPNSLKAWDAREDLARADEMRSGPGISTIYPSPAEIINLAREVNAPSLLPSAFYDLSRYDYTQIFEQDDEQNCPSIAHLPLSNADLQRLALGKEASQHAITTLIRSMGLHSHPHLLGHHGNSHRSCRRDFSELVTLATQHYLFDRERGCTDPLYVAEELGQPLYDFGQSPNGEEARIGESRRSAEVSECEACARALATWAARERERMWKMIPLWFRLDV